MSRSSFSLVSFVRVVLTQFYSSTTRSRAASKGKPSKAPLSHGRKDDTWVINFDSSEIFYEKLYIRIDISSEDDAKSVVSVRSTKRRVIILLLWHASWSWQHILFSAMSIDDEEFPHTPPRRGYVSSCFKYAHFHVCTNRRVIVPKTPVSSRTPRYLYMFDLIQVFDSQMFF